MQQVAPEAERAERGLEGARLRMLEAQSEDEALRALTEALCWVYGLEEWNRHRLKTYFGDRDSRSDGQLVAGLVWARRFAQHELVTTAELGDHYSDHYTDMYGMLVWLQRGSPPPKSSDNRAAFYDEHLADRTVTDTIATAQRFFKYIRSVT